MSQRLPWIVAGVAAVAAVGLTCFESDHGARCDICMGEATLAAQLAARGSSLAEIRHAIDQRFGP